jgi:hypothetical protein
MHDRKKPANSGFFYIQIGKYFTILVSNAA